MANIKIEIKSNKAVKYNGLGEPIAVSIQANGSYFITNTNMLCIYQDYKTKRAFPLDDDIFNSAIQLKYLTVWGVVVIVIKSGVFLLDPTTKQLFDLHSFNTNVTSASWNPNDTFLLIVDEENVLYGFTLEKEHASGDYLLTKVHTGQLNAAVPKSVYEGCGSDNTQFKEAKKKDEEMVEDRELPYGPPVISWRENGEQFVINFWNEGRRVLKVFDTHLKPEFQSEAYPNLLAPTSFNGQGNLIACAAQHNERSKIVIFEKNCRVKSDFMLSELLGRVRNLQYHSEMNILAVHTGDSTTQYINIYLDSNNQWYLKRQLVYSAGENVLSFQWTTFLDNTLCGLNIFTSTTTVEKFEFKIVINSYPDTRLVSVIDGEKVRFAKFSEELVALPVFNITLTFEKPIKNIFVNPPTNHYQFLTSDNDIYHYFYENGKFTQQSGIDLPDLAEQTIEFSNVISYKIQMVIGGNISKFLIDEEEDLLVNDSVVCSNVLSMSIHENYFLFSHASGKLFCVRLTPKNLHSTTWNLDNFYSREVEQGTIIISVTPNADIIIQSPTGNLEAVTCPVIAIDTIEKLLEQNNWKQAIYAIRKQRLMWNLLIDLNPERFSEHIREFIEAADTISELNSMISEFCEEDCLQTVYKNCLEEDRKFVEFDKTNIFQRLLNELDPNPVENLIGIVSIQTKHFSLKSALQSVKFAYEKEELELCKRAVLQILLYRDVKEVVREAAKLYDLDFIRFICTNCSVNPTKFVPVLEKLSKFSPLERRFRINRLVKDYNNATRYLLMRDLSEKTISDFIIKHSTQRVAYGSVSESNMYFKLVSQLFASYLALKSQYNEAGFVLESADLHREALKQYKKALNTHKVIEILDTRNVQNVVKKKVLLKLANDLVTHKRIDEAIMLYEHHCGEYEMAIRALIREKMFRKALSIAKTYSCSEMAVAAIVKCRLDVLYKITELERQFQAYTTRLQKIRQQKLIAFKNRLLDVNEVGSGSSRGSTMSSGNRRKQVKKKKDLREGGVYEDIAIIRQLYLLAVSIFECEEDVEELRLTLRDTSSRRECTQLQKRLCYVQEMVRSNIPKIWSDTFLNAQESADPEVMAVIDNRDELAVQFRIPPPACRLTDSEALEEYKKALNTRKVIEKLNTRNLRYVVKKNELLKLANDLVTQKRIEEAIILYEHHCREHEMAIRVLIREKMFQKALSIAKRYSCSKMVVAAIVKCRLDVLYKITELERQFQAYTTRLQKIRRQKLIAFKNRLLDVNEVGSGSSRGSTMSSRNRRKQEKKKKDLREGGVYEDIAIIRQLYLLAVSIFECGEDVKELGLTLTDTGSREQFTELQKKLCSVQEMVKSNIPKIWSDTFLNAQESADPEVMAVIDNRDEIAVQFRIPPPACRLTDSWKLIIYDYE